MAEVNPPIFVPVNGAYGSDELGLPYRDLIGEGAVSTGDLAVTDGSTGLEIQIAAGACWVKGDDSADSQPTYRCRNDATKILTCATADGSNPRIDRVVAEVLDTTFGGGSDLWQLRIVAGTPAASPVAPAEPDNAISLALVTVAAGATVLNPGDIQDVRPLAKMGGAIPLRPSDLDAEGATDEQILAYDTPTGIYRPKTLIVPKFTETSPNPPASPANGDYWVCAIADQTDLLFWTFRYSSVVDQWLFVGGPPIRASVDTRQTTSSAAYTDLATAGPTLTVQRAGRYEIHHGCRWDPDSINQHGMASISVNGGAASDNDAVAAGIPSAEASTVISLATARRLTISGAHSIAAKYKSVAGGPAGFSHRWLEVVPIYLEP